jgi:hypothetical protein
MPDSLSVSDWESQFISVMSSDRMLWCHQELRRHISYDDPLKVNIQFTEREFFHFNVSIIPV